ncbi:hypothetical protein Tco_1567368, partial [Tanacetum coccineum]
MVEQCICCLEEEQASARLVQQLQAEDLAQADVPLVSEQRAKELDREDLLLLRRQMNSSVHVLDLTNGKTVYMFVDKFYSIRAPLLERMLRHRLTVPPSYCRDIVVAGGVIQTIQDGLRESYECLASAPIACTARQMVFSSPWLTAEKEFGSPLQTALVCFSNPLIA